MTFLSFQSIVLLVVLAAIVVFVLKFLVADLPDDFLDRVSKRSKQIKEERHGGVRDNG